MEALEERIVLSYLGSFRVPVGDGAGHTYSYGGDVSSVDAEGDELWLSTHVHKGLIGKISIPDPVTPSDQYAFGELPIASATAAAIDITQGLRNQAVQDSFRTMIVGDLAADGNRVRWVMHDFYNVAQKDYRILGSYNTDTGQANGPYGLFDQTGQHVRDQQSGRYLAEVPPEWVDYVGGTYVAGGGGLPGNAGIGAGPSLYAFTPPNPDADPLTTEVTATRLLQYPFDNNLPEDERRALDGWNAASESFDMVWIGDTVVFAVSVGVGETWYGSRNGPGDLYDAYDPYKGYHAESYEMRLLFYHASDLVAVANGQMDHWEPQPYASVLMPHLMGPQTQSQVEKVSMSWDEDSGRLYVVQSRVDTSRSRYARDPVVHVYDMSGPDALKQWAFQLSGEGPTLRKPEGPTLLGLKLPTQETTPKQIPKLLGFGKLSLPKTLDSPLDKADTTDGAKAVDNSFQKLQSFQFVNLRDDSSRKPATEHDKLEQSKQDQQLDQFWSLNKGGLLADLNKPLLRG